MQSIETQALALLKAFIKQHGSQRKAAAALGVTPAMVSFMVNGKSKISPRILQALGVRLVSKLVRTA